MLLSIYAVPAQLKCLWFFTDMNTFLIEKQQKIAKILKQTGFTWPISSLKLQLVSLTLVPWQALFWL